MSPEEEYWNREKKYIVNGHDVRRFSNSLTPQEDPYYGRRRVSRKCYHPRLCTETDTYSIEAEIVNVGDTGLTPEQEHQNRERKYSVGGHDVRKFSRGGKSSLEPSSDPYYNRKKVSGKVT